MLSFPSVPHLHKRCPTQDQPHLMSNRLLPIYTPNNNPFSPDGNAPIFMTKSQSSNPLSDLTKSSMLNQTPPSVWVLPKESNASGLSKRSFGFNLDSSFPTRPRHKPRSERSSYNLSLRNISQKTYDFDNSLLINTGAVTDRKTNGKMHRNIQLANGGVYMPIRPMEKLTEYFERSQDESSNDAKGIQKRTAHSIINTSNDSQLNPFATSSIQYADDTPSFPSLSARREETPIKKNLLRHIAHASVSGGRDKIALPVTYSNIVKEAFVKPAKLFGFPERKKEILIEDANIARSASQKIKIRDILKNQAGLSYGLIQPKDTIKTEGDIFIIDEIAKDQFNEKRELIPGLKLDKMRHDIHKHSSESLLDFSARGLQDRRTLKTTSSQDMIEESEAKRSKSIENTKSKSILKQRPVKVRSRLNLEEETLPGRKLVTFNLRKSKNFGEAIIELNKSREKKAEEGEIIEKL